jgi:hypothetical protein
MPILTKNETPAKGQKAEFELDKSALAAIVSDLYFQDSANWKSVEMVFKSNPGKQRRVVKFDASQATPLASFFASARARDIFEIEKIIINDFDNGNLVIPRGDIPNATTEFDVDVGAPVGPSINYIDWDLYLFGVHTLGPEGFIQKLGPVLNYELAPRSIADQIAPDTNFSLTFEALDTDIQDGWSVGLAKTSSSLTAADQFVFHMNNSNLTFNSEDTYSVSALPLNVGTNYFNITRAEGILSFWLNGAPIHAPAYSGLLLPLVRVGGTVRKAYFN